MSAMVSDLIGKVVAIAVSEVPDQDPTGEMATAGGEGEDREEPKEPLLLRPRLVRL